jgi:hypothetical protein
MASALAINDIVQVTTFTWAQGQLGLNNRYYLITGLTGAPTDSTFAQGFDTLVAPFYQAIMTSGSIYYGTKARIVKPFATTIPQYWSNNQGPGAVGTAGLPTQVRGMLKRTTATVGRKGRGRLYLPFPDASSLAATPGFLPGGAYLVSVTNLANATEGAITLTVGALSIGCTSVITGKTLATPLKVTNWVAEKAWGTQRRSGSFGRQNPYPEF